MDSCGTAGYHVGTGPDERTMSTLKSHGIEDYQHAARQVSSRSTQAALLWADIEQQLRAKDFEKFDYIFCMDRQNLQNAERVNKSGTGKAKVMLFGEYSGKKGDRVVNDPYYVSVSK